MTKKPIPARPFKLQGTAPPSDNAEQLQDAVEVHRQEPAPRADTTTSRPSTNSTAVSDAPAEWGAESEFLRSEPPQPSEQSSHGDRDAIFNDTMVDGVHSGGSEPRSMNSSMMMELDQMTTGMSSNENVLDSVGMMFSGHYGEVSGC